MPLKINLKSVGLYAVYAIFLLCINRAVSGVPLSLGLCFAMLICGTNIVATTVLYVLASIVNLNWITCLLSVFEGGFLCAVTLIYRKTHKKIRAEAAAYLAIALAPFIAFSPFEGIELVIFTENAYILKAIAAVVVMAFAFFCFKSIYALIYRLNRCRLRADELVCLAIVFTVFGTGLFHLTGLCAYLCFGAGVIIFAVRLFRSPAAVIVACVAGIPCALCTLSVNYITAFVLLSALTLLFVEAGRGAPSAAGMAAGAAYFYFNGMFSSGIGTAIVRALLLFCCCMLPVLPTDKRLEEQLNLLKVKKVAPGALEQRFKFVTGEKLFRVSEVFREIECAFKDMDDGVDGDALRGRMGEELQEKCCTGCDKRAKCKHTTVYTGFKKLIDCGCIRGKVSLVDLPADVTANCSRPTDVMNELNKLLADYRRYMLEAENMKSGRLLLANQAKGIAEVLKNCAVDLSKGGQDYSETEKKIANTLTANGIACPEIAIVGEDNCDLYLTVVGKIKIAALREILYEATGKQFILKDKIIFDAEKSCLIFTAPPPYDAAFGVAHAVKEGESVSGDTHTVIKINEHSFLMALSDGMGSGEYARKVSATAISLIEAFYRAEMPTDTVLDTINKLICFNRDERFTCIDIAAIDLNQPLASFIKIGSPAGIIVRSGEIKVLESRSLPLGILDSLRPTVCKENLKNGDIVVFMSDGITSAFPSSTELYEFLGTLKPLNPQSLAEKILAGALDKAGSAIDDMTVVCTRIFKRQFD